jgi:hypothetical protein
MAPTMNRSVGPVLFLFSLTASCIVSAFFLNRPSGGGHASVRSRLPMTSAALPPARASPSIETVKQAAQVQPPRKHKSSVVELLLPIGELTMQITMANDDLLTRAVKETSEKLLVVVYCSQLAAASISGYGSSLSLMTEYVSSLYSRVWDEMIQCKNVHLDPTIMGDFDRTSRFGRGVSARAVMDNVHDAVSSHTV